MGQGHRKPGTSHDILWEAGKEYSYVEIPADEKGRRFLVADRHGRWQSCRYGDSTFDWEGV